MIRGLDTSHYQGLVNFAKVGASGIEFAFVKCTQGASYVDPMFVKNFGSGLKAGLLMGAYHFFDPLADPVDQAQHFQEQLKPFPKPYLIAVDLEWAKKPGSGIEPWETLTAQERQESVSKCLDTLQETYHQKPIIYTSGPFSDEFLVSLATGYYPIWMARYAGELSPRWERSAIWQNSDKGTCPGVSGPVDTDRSDLSLPELQDLAVPV